MSSSEPTQEQEEAARRVVAANATDTDEEYELLCALGLM
jgi:hypothetical protein